MKTKWILALVILYSIKTLAFSKACFTPDKLCLRQIIQAIEQADKIIYLQANNFTSNQITRAIINAHERGVHIKILLDKTQWQVKHYSASRYLLKQGVPIWIDYKAKHANNNVLIIDKKLLILGGINHEDYSYQDTVDNILFSTDKKLVKQYLTNWKARKLVSKKVLFPLSIPIEHEIKRIHAKTAAKIYIQRTN